MTNWKTSEKERTHINKVLDKLEIALERPMEQDERLNHQMNLTACHLNGTPLDFEKMIAADDFNLIHDIVGIEKHINKDTGKIERHFLPRCAA